MNNEKFSALVTVYYYKDSPVFLDEALCSVFNQILLPNEVIILANGKPADELYAVINNYEKILYNAEKDNSASKYRSGLAINEGLKNCSYDLVIN